MFQLSKKVEYALIAVRHMAMTPRGQIVTAKEIADRYHISYELIAKILQRLARAGFISSYQGVKGGYVLARNPGELKVSAIIHAMEGRDSVAIIQCEAEGPTDCVIHQTCTIKNPLVKLQMNINRVFDELTIIEMV